MINKLDFLADTINEQIIVRVYGIKQAMHADPCGGVSLALIKMVNRYA